LRSVVECYRGRDVRVFRLDDDVLTRLRARAEELLAQEPRVVEVRLFGSLARGDAHPGSDADVLVVVQDVAGPFRDRIPAIARYFTGVGVGCDVLVYTEEERARLAGRFARAVLEEGILLAARMSPPSPRTHRPPG
jgi:predicted nucleotidyltransferase